MRNQNNTRSPKHKPNNYAFIDSQNLNLGVNSLGWKIDYAKFRLYLKNKFSITKAYVFIGLVDDNQELYTTLQEAGFILVFKPTVRYFQNGKETVKGNVDAELVLNAAAIEYSNYDKALIVTGDGDFACLVKFLIERGKLLKLVTPNQKYSKLLNPYDKYIVRIDKVIQSFGFRDRNRGGKGKQMDDDKNKTRTGVRSKP